MEENSEQLGYSYRSHPNPQDNKNVGSRADRMQVSLSFATSLIAKLTLNSLQTINKTQNTTLVNLKRQK